VETSSPHGTILQKSIGIRKNCRLLYHCFLMIVARFKLQIGFVGKSCVWFGVGFVLCGRKK